MSSDVMCLCVFLLFSGLQFTTGCVVESSRFFICSPGETVLLNCRNIKSRHTEVQWWFSDRQILTPQYSVFPVDAVEGQRYRDRVQIHENLSLSISRLTVDDTGIYWCKTTKNEKISLVQLYVEGCSISGSEGSEEISRYSGESVFLSCLIKCSTYFKPYSEFRWILPDSREINHTINPTELHRVYQGRFQMFDIRSGNLSLMISDLTEEDEGLYSCWSNNQHKSFRLTVKGCTLSETEESKTKYPGDSVLLSCSCEDPNTKPEDFRWTRVESSETEVSSETPRYKDRVHTFHETTPSNLSLLISNLTQDDQGTYRCTVNRKTSADTRLIVKDSSVISVIFDYRYYLIFLVFLLGLMMLLVAGCIYWRFTKVENGSRGSREIRRAKDENDMTYAAVALNKSVESTEVSVRANIYM